MMHPQRRWSLSTVASSEELAKMLTERAWTCCTAFIVAGKERYVFLNDATCADGAQEYAIVRKLHDGSFVQIESINFSWASPECALALIRSAHAGEMDANDWARPVDLAGKLDA